MPLKLTLKPNEKVLIGTSVIANGPAKTEFVVLNRVPVVREKDIITEEQADTVGKKLYVTILNMYINPAREKDFHGIYFVLMRQMISVPMDARAVDLMVEMSQHILGGDHYRALKLCRHARIDQRRIGLFENAEQRQAGLGRHNILSLGY